MANISSPNPNIGYSSAGSAIDKKSRKSIIITIASCAVFLAVFSVIMIFVAAPLIQYNLACEALEDKRYEEASIRFGELGDFRDSVEKRRKIRLIQVQDLMDSGRYREAAEIYMELGDNDRYLDAYYQYGSQLTDNKSYQKAIDVFYELGDYQDSPEKLTQVSYLYGIQLIDQKEYKKAIGVFSELGEYLDSQNRIKECHYKTGLQFQKEKDYDSAIKEFQKSGNYEDSKKRINQCYYKTGLQLLGKKMYEDAIELFGKSGDYSKSKDRIKECHYKIGLQYLKDKSYEEAIEEFTQGGDYSDSKEKIKEVKYAYVKENKNRDDLTTYQYLKDLQKANYKDSKKIYKSLYAWKLTDIYFNTDPDSTIHSDSISRYSPVYCHFTLSGGPPDSSTYLYAKTTFPDGSTDKKDRSNYKYSDGESISWGWSNGLYYNPELGDTGTLSMTFYDGADNTIGKGSVYITY